MGERRRWRKTKIAGLVLLVFLAVVGRAIYKGATGKSGNSVDFPALIQAHVEKNLAAYADEPNTWPVFLEVVAILEAEEKRGKAADEQAPTDWDPNYGWPFDFMLYQQDGAPEVVRTRTAEAAANLKASAMHAKLDELARSHRALRPQVKPDEAGTLIGVLLPEIGSGRRIARYNVGRMRSAIVAKDKAEYVRAFEANLAIARHLSNQFTLIDRLVAHAIWSLTIREVSSAKVLEAFGSEAFNELAQAMDRQFAMPPMSYAMEGERFFMLDTIQWAFTDDGNGDGSLLFGKFQSAMGMQGGSVGSSLPPWLLNAAGLFLPGKAKTTAKANELYDGFVAMSKVPVDERSKVFDTKAWESRLPRGYFVLSVIAPAIDRSLASWDQVRSETAIVRAHLAVEGYRALHGSYPENVEALLAEKRVSWPVDPQSGKPLTYKKAGADRKGGEPAFEVGGYEWGLKIEAPKP